MPYFKFVLIALNLKTVLQDYLLRLSLQMQVQHIILGYFEPTSTFISRRSIDLCISGKLNDEIINGEISLRYQLSTNAMVSRLEKKLLTLR